MNGQIHNSAALSLGKETLVHIASEAVENSIISYPSQEQNDSSFIIREKVYYPYNLNYLNKHED